MKTVHLKAAFLTAAMVWGAWSLIPVGIGLAAACGLVLISGFEALTLPTPAFALGASSLTYTVIMALMMRPGVRQRFSDTALLLGKLAAFLFVAIGCMTQLISSFADMRPAGGALAHVSRNVDFASTALVQIGAWMVVVVVPVILGALATRAVLTGTTERRHSQSVR